MREIIYIGGYSNSIRVCELSNGKLRMINNIETLENPSYLNINNDMLYVVSETNPGSIISFNIVENDLIKNNDKKIGQSLPCYITTNKERNKLLVANYESGSIMSYEIEKDGSIGAKKTIKKYNNSHMHFAEFYEDSIYAIDLGNDAIYIYNSKMELIKQIDVKKESGPRHMVIGKDGKRIYIVTELSNRLVVYEKEKETFNLIQTISTLPDENVLSYAGAIKISNDGKNIYITNRGHNSISVFKNNENGLNLIQNISSYGEFPRDILLNETEEYAIVANQKSNNVVTFKRNTKNGMLSKMEGFNLKVDKPSCIVRRTI